MARVFPSILRLLADLRGALGAGQVWGAAGLVVTLGVAGTMAAQSGFFEERLQRTSMDSVDSLSLGLGFGSAHGFVQRGPEGPEVAKILLDTRVVDGRESVALDQVIARASDGVRLVGYQFLNATAAANGSAAMPTFEAVAALDQDGSVAQGTIGRGDVVDLVFDLKGAGLALAPRETLTLRLQSGGGPVMQVELTAPPSLGGRDIIVLESEVLRGA